MDEQLRVGLVGAGPWARAVHAPGVANHPGTRLSAVWARRPAASLTLPVQPPIAEFTVFGKHGHRTLSSGDTSAQDCFTILLNDFVAMVHSATTEHPCDVRRGLHLQRILERAREKAEPARGTSG